MKHWREGDFLVGQGLSLADLHFAPMIGYFTAAPDGANLFKQFPKLSRWWSNMKVRPSQLETDPGLPDLG